MVPFPIYQMGQGMKKLIFGKPPDGDLNAEIANISIMHT